MGGLPGLTSSGARGSVAAARLSLGWRPLFVCTGLMLITGSVLFGCRTSREPAALGPTPARATTPAVQSLFDGTSLEGWMVSDFGAQGDVYVEDGTLILEMGDAMTGITWDKPFPTFDYEVSLKAARLEGSDFFCGLTFPVRDQYCSLIVGGWGGTLVGLSSIDGYDASENNWSTSRHFENGRWYDIRLRVAEDSIRAWIDGELLVAFHIDDHDLSIRPEVSLSLPFGLATWRTKAALRDFTLRHLRP